LASGYKIVLIVEYRGTNYHGFQYQTNAPTIQAELEKALKSLCGENIRVIAASRTDAGVHARGQVVSFYTGSNLPERAFVSGLNYYLPADIAVKKTCRVEGAFNVRKEAISREYRYSILNNGSRSPLMKDYSYLVTKDLDIDIMNRACNMLLGEHDFSSFASSIKAEEIKCPRKTVYRAEVKKEEKTVVFDMTANSFLIHQVRNTVGSLTRIGLGMKNLNEFQAIIKARKPGLAGPMAPAGGLCLMQVNYQYPLGENKDENL
jgi:tRNA pseudouridine38-40 synthase